MPGPAGPATLPTAYVDRQGYVALPEFPANLKVVTLSLPAGAYLVSVTGMTWATDFELSGWCSLYKNASGSALTDSGDNETIAMTEVVSGNAPFTVDLLCHGEDDDDVVAAVRMTATAVGSVINQ